MAEVIIDFREMIMNKNSSKNLIQSRERVQRKNWWCRMDSQSIHEYLQIQFDPKGVTLKITINMENRLRMKWVGEFPISKTIRNLWIGIVKVMILKRDQLLWSKTAMVLVLVVVRVVWTWGTSSTTRLRRIKHLKIIRFRYIIVTTSSSMTISKYLRMVLKKM